jgi:glycosyltransferase involved in cell wall biosynthesis
MRCPTLNELPPPPEGKTGWPWTEESEQLPDTMPDPSTELRAGGEPWPRISIVTPSYNQGQFIEETIRSVLLQGYPDLEYIIIDGGSDDGSVEIIRKYEPWLAYWVSEPDRGQSHAINKGFRQASGQIYNWINSDDFLLRGAVCHIVNLYQQVPTAVAWVGACHRLDSEGQILNTVVPKNLDQESIADWGHRGFFYQPACFFSAEAWHQAGTLDEDLYIAMDLDLWLRLSVLGEFAKTSRVLSAATIHEEAKTRISRADMYAETFRVQCRYGYDQLAKERLARWKGQTPARPLSTAKKWAKQIFNALRARDMDDRAGGAPFLSDR